jgi:hypothetical protein
METEKLRGLMNKGQARKLNYKPKFIELMPHSRQANCQLAIYSQLTTNDSRLTTPDSRLQTPLISPISLTFAKLFPVDLWSHIPPFHLTILNLPFNTNLIRN